MGLLSPRFRFPWGLVTVAAVGWLATGSLAWAAESATFFRGLNLNGHSVTIDGNVWEGRDSTTYQCRDSAFETQDVALVPATDEARAVMIRSSRWGGNRVELSDIPAGVYTVFLYVWEDNNSETFSVSVNEREVLSRHHSGRAGRWDRLGPWYVEPDNDSIVITSSGGAANFSGIEVWRGRHDGTIEEIFSDEDLAFFEKRIRPVLVEHCYECHSESSGEAEGGLLVDSRPTLRRGGGTGPSVVPGNLDASLLVTAMSYTDEAMQMPPDGPLASDVVADFRYWVERGAADPRAEATRSLGKQIDVAQARQFWSLRPLDRPGVPEAMTPESTLPERATWPAGPIDHFVLAKMQAAGLKPAPRADRATLIRRVTFDLIGLPPTIAEANAFVVDTSPDAWRRLVDRLLASPAYGERWGRHWLDVVRFADTAGDNSDFPVPQVHRYRDWVIAALNRDLPYDEFVRDQLAGDLRGGASEDERQQRLIATGYIAGARRFGSRVVDYPQHLTIEDTIDNVGRTFLGLTLACARCHDHKFDPITARDYYAIYGIFHSTRYPWPGIELDQQQRDFIPLESAEDRGALNPAEAPSETAYAVADAAVLADVAVHMKGDPTKLSDIEPRRFLSVLGGETLPDDCQTSGRDHLAEWILSAENPLASRVIANRVWQHHFGRGIVPTPNDFGKQGKPPTHPELLDYLACELRDGGWSLKSLHRAILMSSTYQQSSRRNAEAVAVDPTNETLAGFPRQRLDAEAIRDALLVLGGSLDATPPGEHPFPAASTWKFTQHNPFKAVYESSHRSVYLMTQRIQRHPYLAIFDGADPSASTPARMTSTTPLQALFLLNDPLVHQQAERFAEQLHAMDVAVPEKIRFAYESMLARSETLAEAAAAIDFLDRAESLLHPDQGAADAAYGRDTWAAYVRSLLRLNEFVYLD